jgi:hypothetical protein
VPLGLGGGARWPVFKFDRDLKGTPQTTVFDGREMLRENGVSLWIIGRDDRLADVRLVLRKKLGADFAQLSANSGPSLADREISSANRPETLLDATAGLCQAERRATNRAALATAKSSIPTMPGHSYAAADGTVNAAGQH